MGRFAFGVIEGSDPEQFMIVEDTTGDPDAARGLFMRTRGPMSEADFREALRDGGIAEADLDRGVAEARSHPLR